MVRKIAIIILTLLLGTEIGLLIKMYELFAYWIIPPILGLLVVIVIWGDRWLVKFINWIRGRLYKEKAWLFNMEREQLASLTEYLFTTVHSIDYKHLADIGLIKVKVELLNLTMFTLDIARVSLNIECAGYPLGIELQDNTPKRQVWGQRPQYDLEYQITNKNFLPHIKQACLKCQRLNYQLHITWNLETTKYKQALTKTEQVSFIEVPDLSQRQIDAL